MYKAITGKRSTEELKKDLGIEDSLFSQVMTFMQDSGMVELEPTEGEPGTKEETSLDGASACRGIRGRRPSARGRSPTRNPRSRLSRRKRKSRKLLKSLRPPRRSRRPSLPKPGRRPKRRSHSTR